MLYKKHMKEYNRIKKEILKDKGVKKEYDGLESEFKLVERIIQKRIKMGLTQKELAEKIGTKQSAVSRLESGNYNPSFSFLRKVAYALDSDINISLHNIKK